jgi:hypothetical protein
VGAHREARRGRERAHWYPIVYYALGRQKESDAALIRYIAKYPADAYGVAGVFAFRNQSDEAFEWLDRAYVKRNSGLLQTARADLVG